MVDPKMLELSVYEGIPHLLAPGRHGHERGGQCAALVCGEMERRYQLMAALGVRNIGGYNRKVEDAIAAGEPIARSTWKPPELEDPESRWNIRR